MRLPGRIVVICLLACLLIASAGQAHSRCTRTLAAGADVQTALNHARAGQTICLSTGVYRGDVEIQVGGSRRPPLTLTSAPGARATIAGIVWIAANDVTVSDLHIDGHGRGQ